MRAQTHFVRQPPHPHRFVVSGLSQGLGHIPVPSGDPRAFPLIFEKFKAANDTTNFQGIVDSMQALVKIADPRGQQAFDMLKTKFKDNPGFLQFITSQEALFKAAIK